MNTLSFIKNNITTFILVIILCTTALHMQADPLPTMEFSDHIINQWSNPADIDKSIKDCCDDLADDIFDTQSLIIQCCKVTQSNFEFTWSKIDACCQLTQSNFEHTWSLIESICTGSGAFCCAEILDTLSRDFAITWSLIESIQTGSVCCNQIIEVINEQTFTLIQEFDHTNSLIEACCKQTQSNFEHTWSLIESICTGSGAFCCAEILGTLSRDFAITWSLIESIQTGSVCCNQIIEVINEQTFTLIQEFDNTNSLLEACCKQTQSNFEHTWSLIESICTGSGAFCCAEILDTLSRDFAITWSLIASIQTGSVCCNQIIDKINEQTFTLIQEFDNTNSLIEACCRATQSNFEITWSLIESIQTGSVCCNQIIDKINEQTFTLIQEFDHTNSLIEACCRLTQSNFEFTWSLIENICTGSGAFCCAEILSTLSRDFVTTWSKIDACCLSTQSNFEFTWSKIDACCRLTQSNFEFTWSLIENICTGSGVPCCSEILSSLSSLQCKLGCFKDCGICNNNCVECSLTGSCIANCPNCPTFNNASDGLSNIFCEIKAVEQLIKDEFDLLFEILSKIFCMMNCGCSK